MRGSRKIQHKPYYPPTLSNSMKKPYICRLAPFENGFEFEWFDYESDGEHILYYGLRGSNEKTAKPITEHTVIVDGLKNECEYEFFITSEKGINSNTRLFRTGSLPKGATVINYLHPDDCQYDFSGRYLCSPSLAQTKSGRLVAGMDIYGGGMAQYLTLLFKSEDNGASWRYLTDLCPFYWGSLFCHNDILYILGLNTEHGNLQIACSLDEGENWSPPVTLFYGANQCCKYGGFHRSPMQINRYNGRLYTSCEYGSWSFGSHLPAVLSIDENDDLMAPENWVCTDFMEFGGEWKRAAKGKQCDTIEGNVVKGADGSLYNYLRWDMGHYLRLKVDESDHEKPLEFAGIWDAPVVNSMFRIVPKGNKFLLITNRTTAVVDSFGKYPGRSVLSVFETEDMQNFTLLKDVVNFETVDPWTVGFQYPAVLAEKDNLLMVVRSAFNNANSYHNSNYSLFFKENI